MLQFESFAYAYVVPVMLMLGASQWLLLTRYPAAKKRLPLIAAASFAVVSVLMALVLNGILFNSATAARELLYELNFILVPLNVTCAYLIVVRSGHFPSHLHLVSFGLSIAVAVAFFMLWAMSRLIESAF